MGNRLTQSQYKTDWANQTYSYQPHTNWLTQITLGGQVQWNFGYDANGNLIHKDNPQTGEAWDYQYDLQNRLVAVKKNTQPVASAPHALRWWSGRPG